MNLTIPSIRSKHLIFYFKIAQYIKEASFHLYYLILV